MSHRFEFPHEIVFPSLNILFTLAKNVVPDEMPHCAAFNLGLVTVCQSTHSGVTRTYQVRVFLYVDITLIHILVRNKDDGTYC